MKISVVAADDAGDVPAWYEALAPRHRSINRAKRRQIRYRRQGAGKHAATLAGMPPNAARSGFNLRHERHAALPTISGMYRLRHFGLHLIAALLTAPQAAASERQDLVQLQRLVEAYARKETTGLPGSVRVSAVPLDTRLSLPQCPSPEAFMPPGGRLWGRGAVGIRCLAPVAWTVYAHVAVEVQSHYIVTARPLAQGEALRAEDIATMQGDLARLPAGIVIDPSQAIGRQLAMSLGAGQPLRADMLRQPLVISQGQGVKLTTQGPGFQLSAEGRALGNAAEGQMVQVRGPSGQTISGIARSGGIVEVRY
jgi:flagellar basal body P-ring formation protein FlgA